MPFQTFSTLIAIFATDGHAPFKQTCVMTDTDIQKWQYWLSSVALSRSPFLIHFHLRASHLSGGSQFD